MSRDCVEGLQLIYTILSGAAAEMIFITSSCIPALGGSVIITSGFPFRNQKNEEVRTSFMSPAKKYVLIIPFISELFFASSTASSTYSMPITRAADAAMKLAIVPVPE